ncbi:MAG: ParB/RepB/Spo0J family partition protein [Asticcacaulis sp.]|jgi:ParB family chromosome partitioning protein|uniref:ParB/RepB/Spo0J family partition protein n=1 Tax=Asticcacaulis sp. TaxID=1872648 RepID=UPI0025BB95EF|nr:ParB/RepB/Spo0J family partition protein [Asticcacaulis sp.]MCA1934335.1 ParB/RepB/Spo0J family partition protein [Asticcacaulis sp.]
MSEKQRGLGRGLSALLSDNQGPVPIATADGKPAATLEKPIELLQRNPDQPRRFFSEAEIDDLSASIKEKGVLSPILVRPLPNQAGQFQIIAGERRWRAAQKAGLKTVPVIVRELDDLEVLEIGIIENVQREDLNPIEEARAYKVLMERFGRTQDAVAQVVSKSRSHIANMMRLLGLPEVIQDHVIHGRLSAGHARAIATAANPEALAEVIIQKGLSVRQAEMLARTALGDATKPAHPKAQPNADVLSLEQDLQELLGLNVKLDDKGGKGEVRIAYASLEQLDDVCRRLMAGSSLR